MTIRRIAVYAATVMGTLAVLFLLYEFRQALILFLFSLAAAAAFRPFVDRFTTRGMSRGRALLIVYGLFLVALVLLIVAVGSQLINELQRLADNLARSYDQMWTTWPEGTEFQRMIIQQLPAPADLYASVSPDQENTLLPGLLGFTTLSVSFIGQLVTVIILSIYWSVDRIHFERLWLSLLPVESRSSARDIWRNIELDFGAYIRSEVLQSIFGGALIGVGMWLMGMPYPALIALFAALAWLIPWLGGVLAVLPVTVSGLSQSPGMGIFASAFAIGVLFFLELYIEPRFIRRRQFSSLLSILLIIALIEPFGLFGLIIAPPLAAALELIFRYNVQSKQTGEALKEIERISQLRSRIMAIRQIAENNQETVEPQTLNLLSRLEALIDQADDVIDREKSRRSANRASS